jgi:NTP pyrophosphatase (non-canonical NTP hydrolase)
LLAEELGETTQAIGKILRHGYESQNPMFGPKSPTNREALEKEVADVYVAVRMMFEAGDIRRMACAGHEERKTDAVKKYLHHQAPNVRGEAPSTARTIPGETK